jgi:hypothetical protein
MTCNRDLKRRVRLRQAETGESYVTALRHVRAAVAMPMPAVEPPPPPMPPIDYLEMIDITEIGAALGLACAITMHPSLLGQLEVSAMLGQLRTALAHPSLAVMRAAVIHGEVDERAFDIVESRAFLRRLEQGRTGASASGQMLALRMDGRDGPVLVTFTLMTPPMIARVRLPVRLMISTATAWRHPWMR